MYGTLPRIHDRRHSLPDVNIMKANEAGVAAVNVEACFSEAHIAVCLEVARNLLPVFLCLRAVTALLDSL